MIDKVKAIEALIKEVESPDGFRDILDEVETFDDDILLLYVAISSRGLVRIRSEFEKIYYSDPERFFRCAVAHKFYNHIDINSGDILSDYSAKRILGILAAAESDSDLTQKLESIFVKCAPKIKVFLNKPTIQNFTSVQSQGLEYTYIALWVYLRHCSVEDSASALLIAALLMNTFNGKTSAESTLRRGDIQDDKDDVFQKIEIKNDSWQIIKLIKTERDLFSVQHYYESFLGAHSEDDEDKGQAYKKLNELKDANDINEWKSACEMIIYSEDLFRRNGLRSKSFMENINLTKAEQIHILNILGSYGDVDSKIYISPARYIAALYLYIVVKKYAEAKKYFLDNNNETIFSQVKYYRERSEQLELLNSEYKARISSLEDKYANAELSLRSNPEVLLNKDVDVEKKYHSEIAELNKTILKLKEKLEYEELKNLELFRLREFAFDQQSTYQNSNSDVVLQDCIQNKKIVVIGGHINWRNKLKKKYPSIIVYDGHIETADLSPLDTSDFIFLNVSNMSHGMYYKVMNVLRNNDAPFDYLGRTINQELYEQEMAEILIKHKI